MMQLGILLIIAALVGVDQLTKWLAVMFLEQSDPVTVIEGVFSLQFTQNTGAAWSLFEGQKWLLIGVTSVMVVAILAVLMSGRFRNHRMATLGGMLVVGGGLGNLIDRIFRDGGVVDFFKTDFIDYPIFNVADCFVVVGAVLLFVYFLFFYSDSTARGKKTEEKVVLSSGDDDIQSDAGDGEDAT